jgi:hypothetical protein
MCDAGVRLLVDAGFSVMCRTDVASYYASVDLGLLLKSLVDWGVELRIATLTIEVLDWWRDKNGLRGLPIGPEFSAVLGNAFLMPLDRRMRSDSVTHLRYMDDVFLFSRTPALEDVLQGIDQELNSLSLQRSVNKTKTFTDRATAIEELQDSVLAYAQIWNRLFPEEAKDQFRQLFNEEILGTEFPIPHRFRWIVRGLIRLGDPYGVDALASSSALMSIDPMVCGEYIGGLGMSNSAVRDALMDDLYKSRNPDEEGVNLHRLRAATNSTWGRVEGEVVGSIAVDPTRSPAVRAWAWKVLKATPKWKLEEAAEAAVEEKHPVVRRAILTTFYRTPSNRLLRKACEKVVSVQPDLKYTSEWVQAA